MNQAPQAQRLFVGLGNPGKKYELTRHNIGFLVVTRLTQQLGWSFKEDKQLLAEVAKGRIDDTLVHIIMPTTYMNDSGRAVRSYLNYNKLSPEVLTVIADDVDLPYGTLRLRRMGGSGGHNGLKSIEIHLGTNHFARLRMGVGRGKGDRSLADYVLSTFEGEELEKLPKFVEKGTEALKLIVSENIVHAMNKVNASPNKEAGPS